MTFLYAVYLHIYSYYFFLFYGITHNSFSSSQITTLITLQYLLITFQSFTRIEYSVFQDIEIRVFNVALDQINSYMSHTLCYLLYFDNMHFPLYYFVTLITDTNTVLSLPTTTPLLQHFKTLSRS